MLRRAPLSWGWDGANGTGQAAVPGTSGTAPDRALVLGQGLGAFGSPGGCLTWGTSLLGCSPTPFPVLEYREHGWSLLLLIHGIRVLPTEGAPVAALWSCTAQSFLVFCLRGPLVSNFRLWFLQEERKKPWLSRRRGVGTTFT